MQTNVIQKNIVGFIIGNITMWVGNNLYKKTQLQQNKIYSGAEFLKLKSTDYYRIAQRYEGLCDGKNNFEFREKEDFIKNCLPNFNRETEGIKKLVVTEKDPKIFVQTHLVVFGKDLDWKLVNPDEEFN